MAYYHLPLSGLFILPIIWVLIALAGMGLGLLISGLSLRYRDLQQVLPFALQLLFFVTPAAYPSALFSQFIPESALWITYLNPITGILDLFRTFLFNETISPHAWISMATSLILFILGTSLFARIDRKMADLI